MSSIDKAYYSNEVAGAMQIGGSTLRKWCLALEEKGYEFIRGRNNSRAFTEQDLIILRRMKELIQNKGITLETAAEIVMAGIQQTARTEGVLKENRESEQSKETVPAVLQQNNEQNNELLLQILERQQNLEDMNRELMRRLDEQQNYISRSLEERDRNLMQAIREQQETKKLIAASIERQEEQEREKENRNWFQRLFNK